MMVRAPIKALCCSGILLLGMQVQAALAQSSPPEAALDAAFERRLDESLAADPTRAAASALYTAAVIRHGSPDQLFAELDRVAADESEPEERQRSARLLRGWSTWRFGDLLDALSSFEAQLAVDAGDTAAGLARARLLDARGETEDALEAYESLIEQLPEGSLRDQLHLRIALMAMEVGGDEKKNALAAHAQSSTAGETLRNRASVVLALLSRPTDAISLFEVSDDPKHRFQGEIRVAEWAIRAEDAAVAQAAAWRAASSAALRRDRRYALSVLVEAHRQDDSLGKLADKLAAEREHLTDEHRAVWIDVLRETGQHAEAIALFEESAGGELTPEMRVELLEMVREAGEEEAMMQAYRDLISADPERVLWREGLARFLLERGDREGALEVWGDFRVASDAVGRRSDSALLDGADALRGLGLYDLARACAHDVVGDVPRSEAVQVPALLFLFALARDLGELDEAEAVLVKMDELTVPTSPARLDLSECWEQIGRLAEAASVLEGVKATRPDGEAGEDLEMRLAWLYSEIGEEEKALEAWRTLWGRMKSLPRRRYVEDRLMTVASRLGKLADIAIELEERVVAGEATELESGFLVRLYTKVKDGVSASEVVDEFLKHSGGSVRDGLEEKARVYLATSDYAAYEEIVYQLIELDPEGEAEYLQQLAMSMLERGKPDEARRVLERMQQIESSTVAAEFEAGVLSLAGMREEAIESYRKGLASHPERIDGYLLMADLMKQVNQSSRAVGMFQYLAEFAERDDLFTIAIDGFLNQLVDAAPRTKTVQWCRRVTLERLAARHDKVYLYQLMADLSEEAEDREGMLLAHENSLAICGPRRTSVLRELMDLARGQADSFMGRGWGGDTDMHLAYGRRLIGTGEMVPPQVYLDLGEAFLDAEDSRNAARTFALTRDLPEHPMYQRRAAQLFEEAGEIDEALDTYQALLATAPTDLSLMVKVGELHESMGEDVRARELYERAMSLLLARQPTVITIAEEEPDRSDVFAWYGARNTDDWDRFHGRLVGGELAAASTGSLDERMALLSASARAELASVSASVTEAEPLAALGRHPRLERSAGIVRRLALSSGRVPIADAQDLELLQHFPQDEELLGRLVRERLRWGYYGSARGLIEGSGRSEEQTASLRALVGDAPASGDLVRSVPLTEAVRRVLPLVAEGREREARELLLRVDFAGAGKDELPDVTALFSAARYLADPGLVLRVGRQWVRLQMDTDGASYRLDPVLQTVGSALDPEQRKGLYQYFVGRILDDPEKRGQLLASVPPLQRQVEEPLASEEQLLDLFDNFGQGRSWGMAPVLMLLPEGSRAGALRSAWSKIAKTQRAIFLLNLLEEYEGEFTPELAEFATASMKGTLADADDVLKHFMNSLCDVEQNFGVALSFADDLLTKYENNASLLAARARSLLELGRPEEAGVAAAESYLVTLERGNTEYRDVQARRKILEHFVPEHAPVLLGALSEVEPTDEEHGVRILQSRIEILEQLEDEESIQTLISEALLELPDNKDVIVLARRRARLAGHQAEVAGWTRKLIELEEDEEEKKKRLSRLVSSWRAQHHPVRALEAYDELEELGGLDEEESSGLPGGFVLPPGAIMIVNGVVVRGGEKEKKGLPKTIEKVKESLEAGETEDARRTLRRLWRQFPTGLGGGDRFPLFIGSYSPMNSLSWPSDPDQEEDAEDGDEEIWRGGLDGWKDEEPEEPEPPRNAYEVLAEHDFAVEEMERFLRTREPRQLDSLQKLYEGLVLARQRKQGVDGALRDLLDAMRDARAGKVEQVMLLALLDENADAVTPEVADVLRDLVRAVSPKDAVQVRRLARVRARSGATEEALRLYRWCATRCTAERVWFFDDEGGSQVTARQLVEEAKDVLSDDDRIALVEAVQTFAQPGDYPWAIESFEQLVIETWEEILGAAALERARAVCERSIDLSTGLRRRVAKRASSLFARAGEIEKAVRAVEVGVCKLDPAGVAMPEERWYRTDPDSPGHLGHADIRRLLPVDMSGFADADGWLAALGDALEQWLLDERMNERSAIEALCLVALREHDSGAEQSARARVERLAARDEVSPGLTLWIVDTARRVDLEPLAYSLERRLLEERRLHVQRVADVVRAVLAGEGPEAALALGEAVAEDTWHEGLLSALVEAAEAMGDASRVQRWSEAALEAAAARQRLEELDAARKAALEAEEAD